MPSRSKRTASCSVQLVDWMMPPSIWFRRPSGLMIWPASAAANARGTRIVPVLRSISTSAITARGGRKFIHERLEREHIGVGPEGAQRRDPQRHRGDQVVHNALLGKIVKRHRVAITTARRLRDIGGRAGR